jgi:competence/damage-inducible protein CinA-like protein
VNAEIIGVGTELLLGQIANTNAQKISQALASIGINVYYHSAVGDNLERMTEVIRHALARSDVVVVTGGLGPTPDDITREAVAAATERALVRDQELAAEIRAIFERLGREMPEENLKQADLPDAAVAFAPVGTAPGFYVDHDSSLIVALPGVPWEMEAMLGEHVLPLLRARSGTSSIVTREVLVIGLGESHTHAKIADIVDAQTNPTIAFLAGGGQVRVRLTAKAPDEAAALELIRPIEEKIRARLGESAVARAGGWLAEILGSMLQERGESLAVAESLTGGLIGAEVTRVEGSSEFFLGSVVAYATESKRDVVGVDEGLLETHGAVSEDAAAALAEGAARLYKASLGLSATGVAGPAEQEGEPVGTIFVGASYRGRTEVRKVRGYGDRSNVRAIAVTSALDLGRRMLERNE